VPHWLRRLRCLATLGHDPDYDVARRQDISGWWAYPCRKCGQLIFPSVMASVDQAAAGDERDA
jgi:hypothetical protein